VFVFLKNWRLHFYRRGRVGIRAGGHKTLIAPGVLDPQIFLIQRCSDSPHAWGWSAIPGRRWGDETIFPTRVGIGPGRQSVGTIERGVYRHAGGWRLNTCQLMGGHDPDQRYRFFLKGAAQIEAQIHFLPKKQAFFKQKNPLKLLRLSGI